MAQIVEGFESTTPVVPRTGNWSRDNSTSFGGSYSLRSAVIGDGGVTDCVMTVPAGATTVTFHVAVSTEGTSTNPYDPFIFLIGDEEKYKNAGELAWHQPGTYALNGATQVTFRYRRDSSQPGGSNAVWIDNVIFTVPDSVPPSVPGNVRVTSMTPTEAILAWTAATDNLAVAGYGLYKDNVKHGADVTGLTAVVTGLTPATAHTLAVDAVDTTGNRSAKVPVVITTPSQLPGALVRTFLGLTPGQSYLVEVDAVDARFDGPPNRSAKASLSVTTDGTPPSVPANLRVTSVSGTQISVAWDASTDAITGVAGYGVYLDGVQAAASHPGLGWTFNNLTPGQTYLIAVDAVDGAGNRSAKTPALSVQAEVDVTPPSVPANLRVTASGPYTLSVAWDASTDPGGLAGYGIYLDGQKVGPDQTALSYSFTGLSAASTYQVAVDAVDASANRSAPAQLTHLTPADVPPPAPGNLRVTAVSYTSWAVAWDAAVDDVQVTGYDVAVNGTVVVTNAAVLQHSMAELPDDTAYTVRVWAVDSIGQRSTVPAELVVSTLNDHDPTAPVFTAQVGEESITVSWAASSDDFGLIGYEVMVDGQVVHTTPGVDYTVEGVVQRRHRVEGLTAGRTYGVRVAAVDTIGQRSADNTVQVVTTPLPFTAIETPVYRIGGRWAGNARDEHGVDWVVTGAAGWSSSPPVTPTSADQGGLDGQWDGAGRYGPRRIELSGMAIAPSRAAMLAAKQRLAGVIHPRQQVLLRVADARMTRQARVRLPDRARIEITDRSALVFEWRIPLVAADPRRYATTAVRASVALPVLPGQASMTVSLAGSYETIPARLRLWGPIKDWVITHEETGTVMRAKAGGIVPSDSRYSYLIDLGARQVWAHVPPEVSPAPRPGRAALAHRPAWFMLIPGQNTITLSGAAVPGQPGTARLALETFDAWS